MSNLLTSLSKTIHASLGIAIILFLGLFYLNEGFSFDVAFWSWITRLLAAVSVRWSQLPKSDLNYSWQITR